MAKKKKEEVCEIVKIEKKGKEETKKVCGVEEKKIASKEEKKRYSNQIRNIFIGILVALLVFALVFFINYKTTHFKYEGVKFTMVQEGELIFYNTFFKMYSAEGAHVADYNFYIRNDPRKLGKDVDFEGDLVLTTNMVLDMEEEFTCDGDGIIAVANFVKLHEFLGMNVIKDENAGCEILGQYTFVKILPGEETRIEKYGPSCYKIYVKDCEILEGTERFMVETFVKTNEVINS